MARIGLTQEFDLTTRNAYTKVDCEVNIKVSGKELPSMSILGAALETAVADIQTHITESYKVPVRPPVPETAS